MLMHDYVCTNGKTSMWWLSTTLMSKIGTFNSFQPFSFCEIWPGFPLRVANANAKQEVGVLRSSLSGVYNIEGLDRG